MKQIPFFQNLKFEFSRHNKPYLFGCCSKTKEMVLC